MNYNIHNDYSEVTGIRNSNISEFSGEDFYHDKLNELFYQCYISGDHLYLSLDGGDDGYTPSFLDESIGNLVYDFSLKVVEEYLTIQSEWEPYWLDEIKTKTYPRWEERRINNEEPRITKSHEAWYRLANGKAEKKVWIEFHDENS